MLRKIRPGDIILSEMKETQTTYSYLVVYDNQGYGLYCLTCGEVVGHYGKNLQLMKKDLVEKFNLKTIIAKELLCDFLNNNYKSFLNYPIKSHNSKFEPSYKCAFSHLLA